MVIVAELRSYLLPQLLVAVFLLVVDTHAGVEPMGVAVARVVVYVENTIEAGVDDVVDDFMYARHPLGVDGPLVIHVRKPGDGNADGTETGVAHHRHQFRTRYGLSPVGLRTHDVCHTATVIGVERVAEVPAYGHVSDSLGGTLESGLRLKVRQRHYGGTEKDRLFHLSFVF